VLKEHLDKFIIVYLNNIIIYSDSEKEHKKHVKWVLKRLYNKNIPIAIKKCKFHTRKTDFVGFIIKPRQISINPKKIKAIINWQDPKSVIDIKLFLGFCNYCRKFIAKWSDLTKPFT